MKINRTKVSINENKIILGIDQSFTNTGITILKQLNINEQEILHCTCISTSSEHPAEERIVNIIDFVFKNIQNYQVNAVAIESPAYQVTSNNGRLLAGLFFSLLTQFIKEGVPYKPINPKSLKKFATGIGSADKEKMKEALLEYELGKLIELSKLKPTSKRFEDVVDSFWLAKYACIKGID